MEAGGWALRVLVCLAGRAAGQPVSFPAARCWTRLGLGKFLSHSLVTLN